MKTTDALFAADQVYFGRAVKAKFEGGEIPSCSSTVVLFRCRLPPFSNQPTRRFYRSCEDALARKPKQASAEECGHSFLMWFRSSLSSQNITHVLSKLRKLSGPNVNFITANALQAPESRISARQYFGCRRAAVISRCRGEGSKLN